MRDGCFLARVGGIWALWRLIGPRSIPAFGEGQEPPAAPAGRSVAVGGHEFFVREAGPREAPGLLLIHGWALDSRAAWHRLMPLLAERWRVIAVDLRGHGKSDRIRGRFAVEDLADEVAMVLDALGPGRHIVVGYSLGGAVAQALARRHPGRVERLVLLATAAQPMPLPRPAAAAGLVALRAIARLGFPVVPRITHAYLLRSGAVPPEHAAWLWETLLSRDEELHHEAGFALARFDSREWVGKLGVPVLCVIPSRDQLIPPSRQRATAGLIPGVRTVEVAGARHEVAFTHPEAVMAAIAEFIDGPPPGA